MCNMLAAVVLLALGSLAAACAADPGPAAGATASAAPLPAPKSGHGRIYFYRPSSSLFPAIRPEVIVNGRKVGSSVSGEAFYRDAYPGDYEIFLTSDREHFLVLSLLAGDTQFVRTSADFSLLGPQLRPRLVDDVRGQQEVLDLTLIAPQVFD